MLIIKSEKLDPRFFFAAEEYILKNFDDEIFMLWRTLPTLMIGRNQNTLSEINIDYAKENNIIIVRRITGGGTVYTDPGNTNFTFISNEGHESYANFEKFARPIINVLGELGVKAEFSGRNDITIEGKKVSGNAQFKHKNRLLHHGTLLYSSNMQDLGKALKPNALKLKSKGVESVRSRVTNISSYLPDSIDIIKFRQLIYDHIESLYPKSSLYTFTEEDLKHIQELIDTKFSTWKWNYGSSPKYSSSNARKYSGGLLEVHFDVKNGKFAAVKIYGDFFSRADIADIEDALIGVNHQPEKIEKALQSFNFEDYLLNITKDEFSQLFF